MMIREAKFDDYNTTINARNFPLRNRNYWKTKPDIVSVELLTFGRRVDNNEILTAVTAKNLRFSTLVELLALAKHFPEESIRQPIVAMGSAWHERSYLGGPVLRYFPYLYSYDHNKKRGLDLFWLETEWDENWAFACTRC